MRLYFAGAESRLHTKLLRQCGVQNRLVSYYYINKNYSFHDGANILLDSGGYTARTKGAKINIRDYITFINHYKVDVAFNLDTEKVSETLENQRLLDENTDATIIPIYHFDEYLHPKYRDLIDRYIEEYDWIGYGGMVNTPITTSLKIEIGEYIFSKTQDKVKVHGLGIAHRELLLRFPWFSTDASSWLRASRYGKISGTMSPLLKQYMNETRHHLDMTKREIEFYLREEQIVTDVWKERGIIWA